jgi:hypothetical protein
MDPLSHSKFRQNQTKNKRVASNGDCSDDGGNDEKNMAAVACRVVVRKKTRNGDFCSSSSLFKNGNTEREREFFLRRF